VRQLVAQVSMPAVTRSTRSRKLPIPHDRRAYRPRNRIERYLNKRKHHRRFTISFARAARFLTFIHLASAMTSMR
jgi:hypothetical protein